MERAEICNMGCEILRGTNDGDDLSPNDLGLVEMAVNGECNEGGLIAFRDLHERVVAGTYHPQWFRGIKHMTIDHEGYIFWKGQEIEHYSPGFSYSQRAKEQALELADRCKRLELDGIPVSTATVIWGWKEAK